MNKYFSMLFVVVLAMGCQAAFAYNPFSKSHVVGAVNNQSNYVMTMLSYQFVSGEGSMSPPATITANTQDVKIFNMTYGEKEDWLGLLDNTEIHTLATYTYVDPTSSSPAEVLGTCVFEMQTINNQWSPTFLDSHCTGPIVLALENTGGGASNDLFSYNLS
ncbi:MAG: hypothetical protein HY939_01635 [Gammaproteobacteria bacterium]|nr:hypothetical protein [Gammaproteobacteria bacterium]